VTDFMSERFFPVHRLAMLPDRWALRPAGSKTQFESAIDVSAPMQTLGALLDQNAASGRLRVTLSHHQVRLFLAPAPPAWLKPAEMLIWLEAALASALGEHAGWRLAWDLTPPGLPIVVAAMPNDLLEGLHAVCRPRGIKLVGVRPWLAEAWHRRRGQLAHATGWYAVLEPDRQVVLRLQGGRVTVLRQRQVGLDAGAELDGMLARESLLADLPVGGSLWLERAGVSQDWTRLGSRYAVHELAGPSEFAQALLQ
jgi:hypothetical protein